MATSSAAIWGVRGHGRQRARFGRMLATGELAPVHLFVGPSGIGKATFARALARAALCVGDGGPECACPSCHRVGARTHPDLHHYAPQGVAGQFTIDLVRALRADISNVPWEGRWRVAILEGIERLNDAAGSALLKTLEEPPAHARLLLVMSGQGFDKGLLPTIDSRCPRVRFGPLGDADVVAVLRDAGVTEGQARALAPLCAGRPGLLLSRADDDEGPSLGRWPELRSAALGAWQRAVSTQAPPAVAGQLFASAVLDGVKEPKERREIARVCLDLLESWLRDRLFVPLGGAALAPDLDGGLLDCLPADGEQLLDAFDQLEEWRASIEVNVDPTLTLQDAGSLLTAGRRGR